MIYRGSLKDQAILGVFWNIFLIGISESVPFAMVQTFQEKMGVICVQ